MSPSKKTIIVHLLIYGLLGGVTDFLVREFTRFAQLFSHLKIFSAFNLLLIPLITAIVFYFAHKNYPIKLRSIVSLLVVVITLFLSTLLSVLGLVVIYGSGY